MLVKRKQENYNPIASQLTNEDEQALVSDNFISQVQKNNEKHKVFNNKSKIVILCASLVVFVSILAGIINFDKQSTYNKKLIESENQPSLIHVNMPNEQIEKDLKQQQTINQDDFQISFVDTNFQGKVTEAQLSAAALQAMENKVGTRKNTGSWQEILERKKLMQEIQNLQEMIPDQELADYVETDMYFFKVSIRQMILNSQLESVYRRGQKIFMISKKQHMRAILRTQLVHNINFKGQIQVQLSPFDKSVQDKKKALELILEDQQIYYQSLYQISKYQKDQLRFCILVPSYNNVKSRLYLRNLDSIFMQDYENYHVVYIDDASPDQTGQYVKKYIKQKNIPKDKIQVIINQENKKAMANIYEGIHNYCPDGQIVGIVDGDDSLLGTKVLKLYNAVYHLHKAAIVYSNFLKILTNNRTSFGFGTEVTRQFFYKGQLRNSWVLVATHFMTFYSDVFKMIKKQDFCYENGTFYDYAYDRAIITPIIQMSFPRVVYLSQITYEYRNDTGINDGTTEWQTVSKMIQAKQPYHRLQSFQFIDKKKQFTKTE